MKTLPGRDHPLAIAGFAGPALLLLGLFMLVPLLFAAAATFTDHRLVSPEPTRYVGLENYARLLALQVVEVEPLRDAAGQRLHWRATASCRMKP